MDNTLLTRRAALAAIGGATLLSMAGCLNGCFDDDDDDDDDFDGSSRKKSKSSRSKKSKR